MSLNIIPINDLDDPRLTDYREVKERQFAADFGPESASHAPDAPFGKFYVEGDKVLHHLVRPPAGHEPFKPLSMLCTPTRLEAARADLEKMPPGTPIYAVPQSLMNGVIGFNMHRGLLGIAARRAPCTLRSLLDYAKRHPGPLVILEDLVNHDNIGAIFRNAGAFGAAGVVLSPRCADPLYRKSLRVSVGLALRVPFAIVEQWPDDLNAIRAAGYTLLATTPIGRVDLKDTNTIQTFDRAALMIGSEGPGLSAAALGAADVTIRITMAENVDSLNAGVCSAVCLWALTPNQR